MQLGHKTGICPVTSQSKAKLTVVHINGIHQIMIAFCQCPRRSTYPIARALLRLGLWLATFRSPSIAISSAALSTFHKLMLQSKINAYDYYKSLEYMTCNFNEKYMPVSVSHL